MSKRTSSYKNFVICNHMGPSLGSMSPTHPQGIRGKKKKKTLLVVVFLSFVV